MGRYAKENEGDYLDKYCVSTYNRFTSPASFWGATYVYDARTRTISARTEDEGASRELQEDER